MDDLVAFIVIFSLIKVLIIGPVLLVRWARNSSRDATFWGWVTEFVGAGTNPHPPAPLELPQASRLANDKKESESGRSE